MEIDCIILAAGFSSRMGRWKPVMPLHGKSLIKHSIDAVRGVCDNIIVVGGYRYEDLKNHLSGMENLQLVHNSQFEEGMLSSLKAGIPYIQSNSFFISLADMPFIRKSTYIQMSRIDFEEVLFPIYRGHRGHPVLIKRKALKEDDFFQNHNRIKQILIQKQITELDVNDPGIIRDLDTLDDFCAD